MRINIADNRHYVKKENFEVETPAEGNIEALESISPMDTGPVMLNRDQFLRADDSSFCLTLARQIIRGKIVSSRVVLMRYGIKP